MTLTDLRTRASAHGLHLIQTAAGYALHEGDPLRPVLRKATAEKVAEYLDGLTVESDKGQTTTGLAVPEPVDIETWTVEAAVDECAALARTEDKAGLLFAWTVGKNASEAARRDAPEHHTGGIRQLSMSGATARAFVAKLAAETGRELAPEKIAQFRKVHESFPDPRRLPPSASAAVVLSFRPELLADRDVTTMTVGQARELVAASPKRYEQCPYVATKQPHAGERCTVSLGPNGEPHGKPHVFPGTPSGGGRFAPKPASVNPLTNPASPVEDDVKTGKVIPPRPSAPTWQPTPEQQRGIEEGERLLRERSEALRNGLMRAAFKSEPYDDRVTKLLALAMGTDSEDEALASFQRARALHRKASR